MKNAHIKPGELVPAEIRLEVYKEAKEIIESGGHSLVYRGNYSLCLVLPCILWGLGHFIEDAPNGDYWDIIHAHPMFPEIDKSFISEMNATIEGQTSKNRKRIEKLQSAIEQLEKELNTTTV